MSELYKSSLRSAEDKNIWQRFVKHRKWILVKLGLITFLYKAI